MKRVTFTVDEKMHKRIKTEALRLNLTVKQFMIKLVNFHFQEKVSK